MPACQASWAAARTAAERNRFRGDPAARRDRDQITLSDLPNADFYVYPGFEPWRDHLRDRHHVTTDIVLARLLLRRDSTATPARQHHLRRAPAALRLRLVTALLYGDIPDQQKAALAVPDPPRSRGSLPR
jgi:hypothetical protein